jgi:hypothetical protein
MYRSEVLQRADAAWSEWREFLAGESAADRAGLTGADGWTLAEAVAHVARWQEWAAERIPALAAGERLQVPDIDSQNAEWAAGDRGADFVDSVSRIDRAWAGLRSAVEEVAEEHWSRTMGRLVEANTWEHYTEHQAWHPAGA